MPPLEHVPPQGRGPLREPRFELRRSAGRSSRAAGASAAATASRRRVSVSISRTSAGRLPPPRPTASARRASRASRSARSAFSAPAGAAAGRAAAGSIQARRRARLPRSPGRGRWTRAPRGRPRPPPPSGARPCSRRRPCPGLVDGAPVRVPPRLRPADAARHAGDDVERPRADAAGREPGQQVRGTPSRSPAGPKPPVLVAQVAGPDAAEPLVGGVPERVGHDPERLVPARDPVALGLLGATLHAPVVALPGAAPDDLAPVERIVKDASDARRRPPALRVPARRRRDGALGVQAQGEGLEPEPLGVPVEDPADHGGLLGDDLARDVTALPRSVAHLDVPVAEEPAARDVPALGLGVERRPRPEAGLVPLLLGREAAHEFHELSVGVVSFTSRPPPRYSKTRTPAREAASG